MQTKSVAERFIGKSKGLLSMLAIASLLAACSTNAKEEASAEPSQNAQKTVINYWYWLDDASNNTMEQLIQKFNAENPDVNVVGRMIPFADYQQSLINSVSTNDSPDVARFKDWWIGQFADSDLLEPLDDYTAKWDYTKDIDEVFWNTGKTAEPNSPIYMMPHQYITFYLYY